MNETNILLINDMTGYGKVALSAMIPVLSYKGFSIYNLPTAIVSNTLNYGKFKILDTTEYIEDTLKIWHELNFSFDAVSTGFVLTKKQMEILSAFCKEQSEKGVLIFNDPIMGDNGKLYDGIAEETVEHMRNILACSDITMPNYTEGCFLTETKIKNKLTKSEITDIIQKLKNIGAKSVVLTSIPSEEGKLVAGYDKKTDEYFFLPYEEIPVYFPGTGDIFSSVIISHIMNRKTLRESVQKAMDVVKEIVVLNKDQQDKYRGISIERCLHLFD